MAKIQPAFRRVLEGFESYSEFARQLGESRQRVHYWIAHLGYVPTDFVRAVSQVTANRVTVLELLNESTRMKDVERIRREERRAARELAAVEEAQGGREGAGGS